MSWTAFGMACLSAALAARTGTFDRKALAWLKAEAKALDADAVRAVRAFEVRHVDDPEAAGIDLQDYVGRLARRLSPPVEREFDWQRRADLS